MSETKETVIVSGDEVLIYMKRIRNYINDLVLDLDRNITDLETKIETLNTNDEGESDNG